MRRLPVPMFTAEVAVEEPRVIVPVSAVPPIVIVPVVSGAIATVSAPVVIPVSHGYVRTRSAGKNIISCANIFCNAAGAGCIANSDYSTGRRYGVPISIAFVVEICSDIDGAGINSGTLERGSRTYLLPL